MKTKIYNVETKFHLKSIGSTTKNLFRMSMMVLAILCVSCDPEDGEDGMNGINGIAGTDGAAGIDGADGAQGPAGEDGNANVQTYTFDISTVTGSNFTVPFAELTQDVLDNDVILTYIQASSNLRYYQIPGISYINEFEVELYVGNMGLFSYSRSTGDALYVTAGQYSLLKAIIIESSSTTAGKSTNKDVLSELKAAGVDANDYYQVADYFGLDY